MKNKHTISIFAFIILITNSSKCFAEQNLQLSQRVMPMNPVMSTLDKQKQIPHHPRHFTKEEMEAKKLEFEKRLNLTEEQKIQIEKNKKKDKEKIKPIIDKLHQKKLDYMMLESNNEIDEQTKAKQKEELRNEIRELKFQADNCRKENMKNFEAILSEEQKLEFEKIKIEQKKEIEKRKKEFHKKRQSQNQMKQFFPKLF